MMDIIRISAAVVLIVGAGLVHGAWTNRWHSAPELAALARAFESVPMEIGGWKGVAFELPPRELTMAGAAACLARRYSDPSRGLSVTVLLVGGLPANIGSHTPDICYPGAGYRLSSPAPFLYRFGPDEREAEFQTALATREGTNPSILRIFWSWNAAKGWLTPENPRWSFSTEPALCKLYVIRETAGTVVDPANDSCNDFMRVFLPELETLVFSARKW
jgi:hypothetical protein